MRCFFLIFIIIFASDVTFGQENKKDKEKGYINLSIDEGNTSKRNLNVNEQVNQKSNEKLDAQKNKNERNTLKTKSKVTIGKLNSPSIGSIGIETKLNLKYGLNLWNTFTAKDAIINLNYLQNVVSSHALQNYLVDLYASISLPPEGNTKDVIKFLEVKLLKISSSGYANYLNEIVKQLPNSSRWERWKKWFVEYNLMKKNDKDSCQIVNEFLKISTNNFWKKAKIICLITEQKFNEANFVHDVMLSQNLVDEFFTELFKNIINKTTDLQLKHNNSQIEPLQIVMLDILKYPIKANLIANFGAEYTEALIDLVYIDAEARSFLLDKLIALKKVDRDRVVQIYQSVVSENLDEKKALSNLAENSNGINRANVWLSALEMKDNIKKVDYILKILDIENDLGRFKQSLELYLPILSSLDRKLLTESFNKKIKLLRILHNPKNFPENNLSRMILLSKGKEWNLAIIKKHQAWGLTSYLENSGMLSPNINWFELIDKSEIKVDIKNSQEIWSKNLNFNNLLLSKAIEQKALKGENIQSLILIGRLFNDNLIQNFDINNLLILEEALKKMGLEDLGEQLRMEILISKFSQLKN